MFKKEQVDDMKNHGIKFMMALKNGEQWYLTFTQNQAIVLESARSQESLLEKHWVWQIQIQGQPI